MKISKILFLFMIVLLLFGCGTDEEENKQMDFQLIASEQTLPPDIADLQYVVKKASDQEAYEELWNLYELEDQLVKVNFDEKNVLFIGLYESSSCPFEIENIEADMNMLTLHLFNPLEECTADASPRTFVIEVEKEQLKNIRDVRMIENSLETTVPVTN